MSERDLLENERLLTGGGVEMVQSEAVLGHMRGRSAG